MLVQYAKTGLSTSSGVSTFSSDSGVTRCPGTLKSQPERLGEKNEIDVDEVERFARYGAVGRQRGNGAGSTGSELTACAASAEPKSFDASNPRDSASSGGESKADRCAAQRKSAGPHRARREERPTDGR